MYAKITTKKRQAGMTIVELVVATTVGIIMTAVAIGVIISWTSQYSNAKARNIIATDMQTAQSRISTDVRSALGVELFNAAPDTNAPTSLTPEYASVPGMPGATDNSYNWRAGSNRLLLSSSSRDGASNPVYSQSATQFAGKQNTIVYYILNGSLYRREIFSSDDSKTTQTCTPAVAAGGCIDKDEKILSNLSDSTGDDSFSVTYYDAEGSVIPFMVPSCAAYDEDGNCTTAGPLQPEFGSLRSISAVEVTLKTKINVLGQDINDTATSRTQMRMKSLRP